MYELTDELVAPAYNQIICLMKQVKGDDTEWEKLFFENLTDHQKFRVGEMYVKARHLSRVDPNPFVDPRDQFIECYYKEIDELHITEWPA